MSMLATTEQMRELDRRTIEERGIPSLELMENAAREAAQAVVDLAGPVKGPRRPDGVIGSAVSVTFVMMEDSREPTPEEQRECCRILHSMGSTWILLKGGHLYEDTESTDLLFDGTNFFSFSVKRIPTKNTHGTGCTLSAAIASNLALGYSVEDSVAKAKDYITVAIAHGLDLGKGHGPTHHFYNLYQHGLQTPAVSSDLFTHSHRI